MKVYSISGVTPVIHPTAHVHPTATLIGDVIVGPGAYVGPNAALRGDFGRLIIEENANIQDCCVMHSFPDQDTVLGANGHVGHGAILHCCRIGKNALVGMNSVVNDKCEIGESVIIAAMSFVKAETIIPPRTLVTGVPAKVVRDLTEKELAWKLTATACYHDLVRRCLSTMEEVDPLTEVDPDRKRIVLNADVQVVQGGTWR